MPVADHLDRPLERLPHPERAEHLTGGALGALLDQRPPAQLDRVHVEGGGDLVHVLLDRPASVRSGGGADRAGGLIVGVDELRVDVDVLDHVRAAGVHRRQLGEEAALAAVGAAVKHELRAPGDHRPIAAHAGLELDRDALAPMVRSDELLLAREHELYRPSRGARQRRDVRLVVEVALGAKATAQ